MTLFYRVVARHATMTMLRTLPGDRRVVALVLIAVLLALACGTMQSPPAEPTAAPTAAPPANTVPAQESPAATVTALPSPAPATPTRTAIPSSTATPVAPPPARIATIDAAEADQVRQRYERLLRATWKTDFSRTTISYDEIQTGGPPKDGIPAIDHPAFESIAEADEWLDDREAVQVVNLNGDARAYPVQIMVWHELVNDTVGGDPVVITY